MASTKPKTPHPLRGRLHPVQIVSSIGHFWLRRSRFTQAVIIGLMIEAVMHFGPPTVLRQQLENAAMDWTIRIFGSSDVLSSAQKKSALAFTFLNIDEATYQEKWGSPFLTPRDKLLTLIKFAASHESRIIIVDVDLTRTTATDNSNASANDQALADYLTSYPPKDSPDKVSYSWPPIILIRRFNPVLASDDDQNAATCRVAHASYFEGKTLPANFEGDLPPQKSAADGSAVPDKSSFVFWASAEFVQEEDTMVRYWRLWEQGCAGGHVTLVPSVELLASALAAGPAIGPGNPSPGVQQLNCWLAGVVSEQCRECSFTAQEQERTIAQFCPQGQQDRVKFGDLNLNLKSHAESKDISQRIIYGIPWKLPRPTDDWPSVQLPGHVVAPILRIVSAGTISDPDVPSPVPPELARQWQDQWFRQRIVVIGGSYADSGDLHGTPLGTLPGAMILINAIHSAYLYGTVHSSMTLEYSLLLVMLLVVSWCFSRWHPLLAMIAATFIGIVILLPVCLFLLKTGAWFDFVIPIVAIAIHHLVVQSEEAIGLDKHADEPAAEPAPKSSHKPPRKPAQKEVAK